MTEEEKQKSSEEVTRDTDRITSWEAPVTYCSSLDLMFTRENTSVRLAKISCSLFPDVLLPIPVGNSFSVEASGGSMMISLYPVFSGSF